MVAIATTARNNNGIRIAFGFVAGMLAVLTFHQAAVAALISAGALSSNLYSMRPVPPLGVPQIASSAFWGGVWGIVFAVIAPRNARSARYWLTAILLGALALPMVGWFIVAPIKGQPMAGGFVPSRLAASMVINGMWGLGVGVFFALLARRTHAD